MVFPAVDLVEVPLAPAQTRDERRTLETYGALIQPVEMRVALVHSGTLVEVCRVHVQRFAPREVRSTRKIQVKNVRNVLGYVNLTCSSWLALEVLR